MRFITVLIFIFLLVSTFYAQENDFREKEFMLKHISNKANKTAAVKFPGDQSIDVKYYGLDLFISYDDRLIDGAVTVKLTPAEASLTSFYLDLQNKLTTDSVVAGGEPLDFTHEGNKITIETGTTYNPGDEIEVTVYYHGTPGTSGFGSFEFNSHDGKPAIWTLSEPYGAPDWFPCKDDPADKADSSMVSVTADSFFVTASNGLLVNTEDHDDGTRTYTWKNSYPIAHYLISLAMTNYHLYTNYFHYTETDSMPIANYSYPENFNWYREQRYKEVPQMLEVFSDLFGLYPFVNEKYGHAEFGWSGAMEHQTITSIGYYGTSIIAHELAHHWFGDMITCQDWHHIWINEGFATYCESLYLEATEGRTGYIRDIRSTMGSKANYYSAKGATGSVYVDDITNDGRIFSTALSYNKGSIVLHMLRGVLGDSLFFKTMYDYANDEGLRHGNATIEDFQRVAEDVSGQDLEYFFSEWLYGKNYPVYSYDWAYKGEVNGKYEIELTLSQETNNDPAFFTMPVDFGFNTAAGDTVVTVFNDAQVQTFTIVLDDQPFSIEMDPEEWIMKDVDEITGLDNEAKPGHYALGQNYPNPFNPSTKISYFVAEKGNVTIELYDILGNKIATLVNETKDIGKYSYDFNSSDFDLSSGVYLYSLRVNGFMKTRKMTLLK